MDTSLKSTSKGQTLGLLVSRLESNYQEPIWHGVMDVAQAHEANLLCFVGGILRATPAFNADVQSNILYDLVNSENVAGLVVVSSSIGTLRSTEEMEAFCASYRPLPMVSIGTPLTDMPSILVDNVSGIRQALVHLIEVHGRRRIAFIRGPEGHAEADLRYQTYVNTLAEFGIPLNPDWVSTGDFINGEKAVHDLMSRGPISFDAVMAANDNMAFAVLNKLQAAGVRIPDDVAVIGFDDSEQAQITVPPLSSVRQPIYELGHQAATTLFAMLAGRPVAPRTMLSTELVTRRSCGCPVYTRMIAKGQAQTVQKFRQKDEPHHHTTINTIIHTTQHLTPPISAQQARQLVNAFYTALETTNPSKFINMLDTLLQKTVKSRESLQPWHKVLNAMRDSLRSSLAEDITQLLCAEDIWFYAQQYIHTIAQQTPIQQVLRIRNQRQRLQQIGEALITTFDIHQLMNILKSELPRLDIQNCIVALYNDRQHPSETSHIILAGQQAKVTPRSSEFSAYPTRQIVPEVLWPTSSPYTFVVQALYFQNEALGFVLFAVGSREGSIYEGLAQQLSSALKGALLLKELQEAHTRVEDHVAERTAELQQEVAERERMEKIQTSLYRISEAANSAHNLHELFQIIHDIIDALTSVDNFYIALHDTTTGAISFPYFFESHPEKHQSRQPSKVLTEFVIRSQKPLLATPQTYPQLVKTHALQNTTPLTTNWLGVPLTIQEQTMGALIMQNYPPGTGFGEEEKHILMFISSQVAMAIERVQIVAEREHLLATLQQRNTQLQTAAEVSKSAITILEPGTLIQQAVKLIQQRFNFYYVGLFMVDDSGEYAVLRAGTGNAGQKMLEAKHKLRVGGSSMIGWCTAQGEARIALDVGEEAIRFDNPLLPHTRSEMALPLISHSQGCIGALSVQSVQAAAFSEEDIAILQTMVDHLAIAIENARLYKQSRHHAAELEQRVNERTAELTAANQELESFSYSVSHDLRAPLRSINGFSQALLEDYQTVLDDTGCDYLNRVRKASQRMGQLIDGMLNLSRLTRGEMHVQSVHLSHLALELAAEFQGLAPQRQVTFNITPGLIVEGDARLLRAALQNLFSNAWKFTRSQEQTIIDFGIIQHTNEPTYYVRDNGVGFDMAYADKLFNAFQRLHSAVEFEGNGIGLATVQRIIHRHGGRIWAESTPGKGATFYFTLKPSSEGS